MPVVTAIDVLGIQGYVFASNRLKDVLAASWMVDHVTKKEQLQQWDEVAKPKILLAAGGNAIVEFDTLDAAKAWTALYTRWLLDEAPGLEAVVEHLKYEEGSLARKLKDLQTKIAVAKVERRPSAAQLGLSVTARCDVTGLPASYYDKTSETSGSLLSLRMKKLRDRYGEGAPKDRWKEFLPATLSHASDWTCAFPDELDLMGRTAGDTSLVGVVHVDGNSVGESIKTWLDRCIEKKFDNGTVRTQYRVWSGEIAELGKKVLHAVCHRVAQCVQEELEKDKPYCYVRGTPHGLGFRLFDGSDDKTRKTPAKTVLLPLRPILLAGDDLTFVCDGRIALDLAATALKTFEDEKNRISHLGNGGEKLKLTACAGVALVKAHAPFYRSYELAEGLCRSAKDVRQEESLNGNADAGGWLDWHMGSCRPGESVADIRGRQYVSNHTKLTMRPYPLATVTNGSQSGNSNRSQTWAWLDKDLLGPGAGESTADQGFRGAESWLRSRHRVKLLRSLVLDGPEAVKRQVNNWKVVDGCMTVLAGRLSIMIVGSWPWMTASELDRL